MNTVFNLCVKFLVVSAHMLGISYQQINVWLFVIIHPLITILFLALFIITFIKYKKLKKSTKNQIPQL